MAKGGSSKSKQETSNSISCGPASRRPPTQRARFRLDHSSWLVLGGVGARLAKAVKNAFDMVPKGCQSYCQGSPQPISLLETPEYSIWVKDIFLKDFSDWTISQNYLKTEVRGNTALSGVREDNCMCY